MPTTRAMVEVPAGAQQTDYRRVSRLLEFEQPEDLLFVTAEGGEMRLDAGRARTRSSSAILTPGTRRVTVKLASLLSGRDFPNGWTLLGGQLWTERPTGVTVRVEAAGRVLAGRRMDVEAGGWKGLMVDLASLPKELPAEVRGEMTLVFDFDKPLEGSAWLDDVMLADNTLMLVDPKEGLHGEGWSIQRKGLNYVGEQPARFRFELATEDVPHGWRALEANRVRARFESDGETKELTVYADGRSYWDGRYRSLVAATELEPALAEEQMRPAGVEVVAEEQGRVDRNTPGDANHDGYNEMRGAYELVGSGRLLQVRLTPRTDQLLRPVLEISGLPAGDARVMVEGQLVEQVLRLGDGRVLAVLPGAMQRATIVTIRVQ